MPDETVEVLVDVRQTGIENATNVRKALDDIGRAAGGEDGGGGGDGGDGGGDGGGGGGGGGGGARGKVDGLARAFRRWEAHEPSRFIRQTSFAVEGLALSAIGTEGPVGRLAASFAMFGTGGIAGLTLLGGLAAGAVAFKLFTASIDETNKSITAAIANVEKLAALPSAAQQRLTLMGGRAALTDLQTLSPFATESRELRWYEQIASLATRALTIGGGRPEGDPTGIFTLADQRREAEETGAKNALARATIEVQDRLAEAERHRAQAMAQSVLAVERSAAAYDRLLDRTTMSSAATYRAGEALERFAAQEDRLRLMTSGLSDAEKDAEMSRLREIRRIGELTAAEEAFRATAFGQRYLLAHGDRPFVTAGVAPSSLIPPFQRPQPAAYSPGATDARGVPLDPDERRAFLNAHPDYGIQPGGAPERGERLGGRLATELPGLIAAFAHGDAGGGLLAGGGILETLGSSKKLGLGALGLPGELLTAFGGLVSLFSGGQRMKVSATLEAETLQRLKEMNASLLPQNYSVILVDSRDARADAYNLSRASRLDQVPRLPYSPR